MSLSRSRAHSSAQYALIRAVAARRAARASPLHDSKSSGSEKPSVLIRHCSRQRTPRPRRSGAIEDVDVDEKRRRENHRTDASMASLPNWRTTSQAGGLVASAPGADVPGSQGHGTPSVNWNGIPGSRINRVNTYGQFIHLATAVGIANGTC